MSTYKDSLQSFPNEYVGSYVYAVGNLGGNSYYGVAASSYSNVQSAGAALAVQSYGGPNQSPTVVRVQKTGIVYASSTYVSTVGGSLESSLRIKIPGDNTFRSVNHYLGGLVSGGQVRGAVTFCLPLPEGTEIISVPLSVSNTGVEASDDFNFMVTWLSPCDLRNTLKFGSYPGI